MMGESIVREAFCCFVIDKNANLNYNSPVFVPYEIKTFFERSDNMRTETLKRQADMYCEQWQAINTFYEDYAKSVGHSYTSLQTLSLIANNDGKCTQAFICERTFLPKQTVNTIITGFLKQGLIRLVEMPENRRMKQIHLTEQGLAYTSKVLPKLREAELKGMGGLDEQQRETLIALTSLYVSSLRESTNEEKED